MSHYNGCGCDGGCNSCTSHNEIQQAVNDALALEKENLEQYESNTAQSATDAAKEAAKAAESASAAAQSQTNAETAAGTATQAASSVTNTAVVLEETAERIEQAQDLLEEHISALQTKPVYFEVSSPTSSLVLPETETVFNVRSIYVASARQDVGYGFTFDKATRTITLADGITADDIAETEEGFILITAICDVYSSDDPTSFPIILASTAGASNIGTFAGITVEGALTNNHTNDREQWRRSLAEAGLTLVDGSFEEGATVNNNTDAVWYIAGGQCYTWGSTFPRDVPAKSTPASSGGVAIGAWSSVDDATLRQELAAPDGAGMIGVKQPSVISAPPSLNLQKWLDDEVVNLRTRFGLSHDALPRQNTDNLQAAYDVLSQAGGARMRLPGAPAPYYFAPSVLSDTFDNFGEVIQASWGCIVARQGVLLEGDGIGRSIFHIELGNVGSYGIIAASPIGGGFRHLSLRGNSSVGGNSHGIFNANISADPIHQVCTNWLVEHVELSDLGSYGLGINNGDITNLRVSHVYIHNVGADGIDTKQRGPRKKNIGMHFSNIVVDGFGKRLTGCAGLDFHGVGQVTNLTVRNPALTDQTGFRMRTMDPTNEGENARMSHASNILVEAPPANNANIGVFIGSPDCVVQGAVARGVTDGFQIVGNASGAPDRSVISNAHAIDCAQYGFFVGTGVNDATLDTAYAIGCATGFRNQGTRTTYMRAIPVNCTTKFSSSSVAAPNERFIGSDTYGMTEYTSGAGTIIKEPKSDAADVEVRIKPKGASRLALMDGVGNRKIQIDQNGVGFNGTAPVGKATVNAAATDAASTTTLVNQIRSALITNGLAQ